MIFWAQERASGLLGESITGHDAQACKHGAGWVPRRCLDTSSDPAVVLVGYDTTELAITAGEELALVERDNPSGWAWVRNAAGREGWVPLRTVEPLSGA